LQWNILLKQIATLVRLSKVGSLRTMLRLRSRQFTQRALAFGGDEKR
jgi:hypothetical protein